jgi:hypothetical protein
MTTTISEDILCKIAETECAICLSNLTHTDFTSTKCGHWFHSSCILQNMVQRVDCPLCRFKLAELPYDSDSDDEDVESDNEEDEDTSDEDSDDEDVESEDDNTEESEETTHSYVPIDHSVTCKQTAQKMLSLGYNVEDMIYILVGRLDRSERTKYTREFRDKFEDDLERILTRETPVDYRDGRTYAQVAMTNEE